LIDFGRVLFVQGLYTTFSVVVVVAVVVVVVATTIRRVFVTVSNGTGIPRITPLESYLGTAVFDR
jgi:hypothetical protein